ncbi:MAG: hypothetical protein C0625_16225 [Arcobacter sp.]|nr:MAG: hypothetical protein C0625_16225 [Arcobacter sp.]
MKIESYDVNMQADSDFVFEQKHTSEFTRLLINSKIDTKEEIHKQNLVKLEVLKLEKVLLTNEKDLTHQDRIKKNILEIVLSNFTNDKNFKIQPSDNNMHKNKKLTQIIETTFKHSIEYTQKSSVEYSTQAYIKTNRGQINIDLNLSFSQSFYEKHETMINSKKTIYLDPLIINYDSNLSSFDNISSTMSFEFDLNSDGKNELIPELKDGSGFLALDKDHNGIIDNGNELFGANTGNGFKELSEYDEDKNNWLDENDSIFSNLLIWEKNESGDNSLISLGQAGIGAIYLSAVDSGFTYSSAIQEDYARLKQSSFYLKENGKAGLVTSVDFKA